MGKYLFILGFILMGCSKKEKNTIDLSTVNINTEVHRFDQAFYNSSVEGLSALKMKYPYLFPEQYPDSVWVNKMKDKDELELFAETEKLYKDFEAQESALTSLFKHIKYYYPGFKEPKVITVLTNVDQDNKIILADSLLFISLDMYLGKEHSFYADFPNYIKRNNTEDHLVVDVADAYARRLVPPSGDRSFSGRMIQEGKRLTLLQHLLEGKPDAELFGYEEEQIRWAQENESEIWKYFIENDLLFSNDQALTERFIDVAPFSKFYLANDQDSPGGIGAWVGLQIVNGFMEIEKVGLIEMLQTPNEDIFKKSKYKPRKV
ncbi:MAG: gliding motility lipoprotein GldB [Flavobacteriaceae bacterium]|nr:gliding motility lipoprotein GldB [Flavobacteriaceae bacterium]